MNGVSIFTVMFFGKLSFIFKSNCGVKGHYEFAALFLLGLIVNLTSFVCWTRKCECHWVHNQHLSRLGNRGLHY
jgi:hypothetical protein